MLIIYIGHTWKLDKQLSIDSLLSGDALNYAIMLMQLMMPQNQSHGVTNDGNMMPITNTGQTPKWDRSYQLTPSLF